MAETAHRIRLHGPWEVRVSGFVGGVVGAADAATPLGKGLEGQPLSSDGNFFDGVEKIQFPTEWEPCRQRLIQSALSSHLPHQVDLTRRFHTPTGLTPEQTVWLVVELRDDQGDRSCGVKVWLNDHPLNASRIDDQAQGWTIDWERFQNSMRATVADKLLARNCLRITIDREELSLTAFQAVYLEII